MPLWDKSGTKPVYVKSTEKREVIATDQGWVQRKAYTDKHGAVRRKDEVLVHIGELASESTMGQPDPTEIYISDSDGNETGFANSEMIHVNVVYDEPVNVVGGATLAVANTVSGNAVVASANAAQTPGNANNTVVFRFAPGGAGTYKIQAQNIANTTGTHPFVSLNTGGEVANLTITAATSNALGTFTIT